MPVHLLPEDLAHAPQPPATAAVLKVQPRQGSIRDGRKPHWCYSKEGGEGTEELIVCTATLSKNKKLSYHSVSDRALCIQTSLNEGLYHALRIAI